MALPMLRRIAGELSRAAKERKTTFEFSLVTNGTLLTRSVVEELLPLGLKGAKLTLDGPPEIHDQQRPFVSGCGSFVTILANIKANWDLLALQLGGNYTRHNYRQFPELLDMLLDEAITGPYSRWSGLRGNSGTRCAACAGTPASRRPPDRKSTRLNSSHLGISYAVF